MYDRDFYHQSQFEPISAVSGGMRVSSCAAPGGVPDYYEVCIPSGWLTEDESTLEKAEAEPPPYGGSLSTAPAVRRYIIRPSSKPTLDLIRTHPESTPEPEPEPKPKPKPPPAAEYKPFQPFITTTPPEAGRENEEYIYQAKAHDGVATGFQWSLHGAPPGMRVDRDSGRVVWTPARGGWYTISLTAFSVYGKQAVQTWTILVKKAVTVHVHRPNPRYRAALERREAALAVRRRTTIPTSPAPPLRVWRLPSVITISMAATAASSPRPRARVTPACDPRMHAAGHTV